MNTADIKLHTCIDTPGGVGFVQGFVYDKEAKAKVVVSHDGVQEGAPTFWVLHAYDPKDVKELQEVQE